MTTKPNANHCRPSPLVPLFLAAVLAAPLASAVAPTPAEISAAHDWVAANLQGGQKGAAAQAAAPGQQSAAAAVVPPFSFTYDGRPSRELLKGWVVSPIASKIEGRSTKHDLTWTDPGTLLQVRCHAVEYHDFPTVEWTLYFRNLGTNDTPLLSDIQALDTLFGRGGTGEFVLHHHAGDNCTPDRYRAARAEVGAEVRAPLRAAGGRPTQIGFPYFNLAWPGEGVIIVVGWPGQWAAQFTREQAGGLRVRAGQELTHFKLHPGEEMRTPLIALQFWQGDRGPCAERLAALDARAQSAPHPRRQAARADSRVVQRRVLPRPQMQRGGRTPVHQRLRRGRA